MEELKELWNALDEPRRRVLLDVARAMQCQPMQEWLTAAQVQETYDVSPSSLYKEAKGGHLECRMPNGKTRGMRFSRESVERWLGLA